MANGARLFSIVEVAASLRPLKSCNLRYIAAVIHSIEFGLQISKPPMKARFRAGSVRTDWRSKYLSQLSRPVGAEQIWVRQYDG